jgi:hypothetical protein
MVCIGIVIPWAVDALVLMVITTIFMRAGEDF